MNASEILKQHDIKKTPGRIGIIKALQQSNGPLSEDDIKTQMIDFYDRITFYRNIHRLSSAGIIHKIVIDSTLVKYGLNCCEKGHIHRNEHAHFYCEQCREVVCMRQISMPVFKLPGGYMLSDSDIIIRGKCEKCNL